MNNELICRIIDKLTFKYDEYNDKESVLSNWQKEAFDNLELFFNNKELKDAGCYAATGTGKTRIINLSHFLTIKYNISAITLFVAPQLGLIKQNAINIIDELINFNKTQIKKNKQTINASIISISSDKTIFDNYYYDKFTRFKTTYKNAFKLTKIDNINFDPYDITNIVEYFKNIDYNNRFVFISATYISLDKINNIINSIKKQLPGFKINLITYDESHEKTKTDISSDNYDKAIYFSATPKILNDDILKHIQKRSKIYDNINKIDKKIDSYNNNKYIEIDNNIINVLQDNIKDINENIEILKNNDNRFLIHNYGYKSAVDDNLLCLLIKHNINITNKHNYDDIQEESDYKSICNSICTVFNHHKNDNTLNSSLGRKLLVKFNYKLTLNEVQKCININIDDTKYDSFMSYCKLNNIKFISFSSESTDVPEYVYTNQDITKDTNYKDDTSLGGYYTNIIYNKDNFDIDDKYVNDTIINISRSEALILLNNIKQESNAILFHINILTCGIDIPCLTAFYSTCKINKISLKQNIGRICRRLPNEYNKDIESKNMIKPHASIYVLNDTSYTQNIDEYIDELKTEDLINFELYDDKLDNKSKNMGTDETINIDMSTKDFNHAVINNHKKIISFIKTNIKKYNNKSITYTDIKDSFNKLYRYKHILETYTNDEKKDLINCFNKLKLNSLNENMRLHTIEEEYIKRIVDSLGDLNDKTILCGNIEIINYLYNLSKTNKININLYFTAFAKYQLHYKFIELFYNNININYIYIDDDYKFDFNTQENMPKIDITIANPPYNTTTKDIYNSFIENNLNICNNICYIVPSKWSNKNGKCADIDYFYDLMKKQNFEYIHYYDEKYTNTKIFKKASISGGVMIFNIDNNKQIDKTVVKCNDSDNIEYVDIKNNGFIQHDIVKNILDKINTYCKNNKVITYDKKCLSRNTYKNIKYKSQTGKRHINDKYIKIYDKINKIKYMFKTLSYIDNNNSINKYKIAIQRTNNCINQQINNKNKGLNKFLILNPNVIYTDNGYILDYFDTLKEAEYCISYIQTKIFRFLVNITISTHTTSVDNYKFVPYITLDREITDEYIKDLFGFDELEYEYICDNVADFKEQYSNTSMYLNYLKDQEEINKLMDINIDLLDTQVILEKKVK